MKRIVFSALMLSFLVPLAGYGQFRVNTQNWGERILCVVPMVGKGTYEDPRRPMFAPVPGHAAPSVSELTEKGETPPEIISFQYELSDDGQYALVEFVARDSRAFSDITARKGQDVKVFQVGIDRKEEIEAEFRKHKNDFSLDDFAGRGIR